MSNIKQYLLDIPSEWKHLLGNETEQIYFKQLVKLITSEYENNTCYPPVESIYEALQLVKPHDVKAVILGQDPYHEKNQANGLAFSVNEGEKMPPSLKNIFKEINMEYGYPIPKNGSLISWAKQGVLLLNTTLTVREGEAFSHSKAGWDIFTDHLISKLDTLDQNIVYMLWGNAAKKKVSLIKNEKAYIIYNAHPSPLSANRGFLGCGCFRKCNDYLKKVGLEEIDFRIQ